MSTFRVQPNQRAAAASVKLLPLVTCPHCWERFPPEEILWISEHVDLLGDRLLGPEQQQRFLAQPVQPRWRRDRSSGHDLPDAGLSSMPSAGSAHDARAGTSVRVDPGRTGKRQVVFPDGHDLAASRSSCRRHSASPSPTPTRRQPGAQRMRGVVVSQPRGTRRSDLWAA